MSHAMAIINLTQSVSLYALTYLLPLPRAPICFSETSELLNIHSVSSSFSKARRLCHCVLFSNEHGWF